MSVIKVKSRLWFLPLTCIWGSKHGFDVNMFDTFGEGTVRLGTSVGTWATIKTRNENLCYMMKVSVVEGWVGWIFYSGKKHFACFSSSQKSHVIGVKVQYQGLKPWTDFIHLLLWVVDFLSLDLKWHLSHTWKPICISKQSRKKKWLWSSTF